MTSFATVYNRFLGKITDDLYLEVTPEDTLKDLQNLLIDTLPQFEFPRVNLYEYNISKVVKPKGEVSEDDFVIFTGDEDSIVDNSTFKADLTNEEINIIAHNMVDGWLQRQVASIENTRMKYSGSDFKFTSQANHLQKLLTAQKENQTRSFHLQRLYKRREQHNGTYRSTWYVFGKSALDEQ